MEGTGGPGSVGMRGDTIGEAGKEAGSPSRLGPYLPVGFSPLAHSLKDTATPVLLPRMFLLPLHSLFSEAAALFSCISLLRETFLTTPAPPSLFLHPALRFFVALIPIGHIMFLFLRVWSGLPAHANVSSMKREALFCALLCHRCLEQCSYIVAAC